MDNKGRQLEGRGRSKPVTTSKISVEKEVEELREKKKRGFATRKPVDSKFAHRENRSKVQIGDGPRRGDVKKKSPLREKQRTLLGKKITAGCQVGGHGDLIKPRK